jgi:hypothetical protein
MKKIIFFTLIFNLCSYSQTIATTGLGQDNSKILEYLKNKKWTQRTESETIEMEFIGFEKESDSNPFSYGTTTNSGSTDPVKNMVFINNSDNLRETFNFNGNGSLSVTYLNTSPVSGTYNFIESEKKLYVNIGNRQRVFTIDYRSGKNLGISGESIDDVRLFETNGSSEFIKTGNNSSLDNQYKSKNYDYLYPENRFLFKYTVYRKRFVTENGRGFVKDVQDVKYGFIYKISVIRRENKSGVNDSNGILLKNPNIPWAEAVLELVVSVGNDTYKPNTSVSQMIESGINGCSINVCNDCKTTDKRFSISSGLDKLYINTCLHDAGWNYNDKIGINYEYYLSAGESKTISPYSDANVIMTFKPVIDVKQGVQLGELISKQNYRLEVNSLLTSDKLNGKTYKAEFVSKQVFGKEKIRTATWSYNNSNQTIKFNFDDGEKLSFIVTMIKDGYIYEFKDSDGKIFGLGKVDKK